MLISILNHSNGKVSDAELQKVVRAIRRQVREDFEPYWSLGATLRLEGRSASNPDKQDLIDMRGDAIVYIWDRSDIEGALGYHDLNNRGIPFGFVFLDIAQQLNEPWSVTLSHEVLELIGDAEVNLLVAGPHPDPAIDGDVFHWYEMCDAVQSETYEIDGVLVSNFVLPLYFTGGDEFEGRNDFLGTINPDGSSLKSFGINPGGYVGFFNPGTGNHETYSRDAVADARMSVKSKVKGARRAIRYQRHSNTIQPKVRLAKQEQENEITNGQPA